MKSNQLCRWAGSKRRILDKLMPHFPERIETYWEPFLGAGSVLLELIRTEKLGPWSDVYIDEQGPLLDVWQALIEDRVDEVLGHYLYLIESWEDGHQDARTSARAKEDYIRAAAFLYLQETSFNGLWRVNAKGEHNVPRDKKRKPKSLEAMAEHLYAIQDQLSVLKSIQIETPAHSEMVAYFDPPYYKTFSSYGPDKFTAEYQTDVRDEAVGIAECRGLAIASNSDHPEIRELYQDFTIHEITRDNRISAKASTRKAPQNELLMVLDGRVST